MLSQPISMIGIPQTSSCGTLQTRTSRNRLHSKARERDGLPLRLARPYDWFQPSTLGFDAERLLTATVKRLETCTHRGDNSRAMKSILVSIVGGLLLVGCATSKSLNLSSISIGMDKQKVIALKGEPFRVAAIDGLEYFIYRGFDLNRLLDGNGTFEAFIRFKDGKVEAYGRLGDFDSTKHKELLIKKSEKK